MKTQGVEILRITDFCRFFSMEEFMADSDKYLSMFKEVDTDFFCNDSKEAMILVSLRTWLSGAEMLTTMMEGQIMLLDRSWVPMRGIEKTLGKFKDVIGSRDRIGLTYLFLLLRNVMTPQDMEEACRVFVSYKSGKPMGDIRKVHEDMVLTPGEYRSTGVSPVYFVNTMRDNVWLTCGTDRVAVEKGACAVGLFNHSGECFRLLPNEAQSEDGGIRMKMKMDTATKRPYVEVKRPEGKTYINDVVSFWIEPGNYIVYMKKDGTFVFDDRCFSLKKSFTNSLASHSEATLAAAEQKDGFYSFYYK